MRLVISLFVILGLPALFVASKSNPRTGQEPQLRAVPTALSNYCNSRFNFCVDYSADLLPTQQVAENGDGVILRSDVGAAQVKVNGSHNVFSWTPAELYTFTLENALSSEPKDVAVVSKLIGEDFYECLLLDDGKNIYVKAFFVGDHYVQMFIEVPANRPELMDSLREDVRITFGVTG